MPDYTTPPKKQATAQQGDIELPSEEFPSSAASAAVLTGPAISQRDRAAAAAALQLLLQPNPNQRVRDPNDPLEFGYGTGWKPWGQAQDPTAPGDVSPLSVVIGMEQYPALFQNLRGIVPGAVGLKPDVAGTTTLPSRAWVALQKERDLPAALMTLRHELGHVAGLNDWGEAPEASYPYQGVLPGSYPPRQLNAYDVGTLSGLLNRDVNLNLPPNSIMPKIADLWTAMGSPTTGTPANYPKPKPLTDQERMRAMEIALRALTNFGR